MLRTTRFAPLYILISLLSSASACYAALTFDNQYFPFGDLTYTRKWPNYSNIIPGMMVAVADHARAHDSETTGLFQLFGALDLNALGRALEKVGKPNPLRSQWRGSQIPVAQQGTLEAIGGTLEYNQAFNDNWSAGLATAFMRVTTRPFFLFDKERITIPFTGPGEIEELDRTLRIMADEVGVDAGATNHFALTDIDTYVRVGNIWDYPIGFRRADLGLRVGALFPTGKKRDIFEAFSIPFAGNGLYGFYVMADVELELKEDLKFGLFGRVQQRIPHTTLLRVPVGLEPINFGAIVGNFHISPGTVLSFSAYLLVEDIRGGLGGSVQYLFTKKFRDHIQDQRIFPDPPANIARYDGLSGWQSEVINARMFYDFSRIGDEECPKRFLPIISFAWDFPVKFFGSPRVAKTNRISITVEIPY